MIVLITSRKNVEMVKNKSRLAIKLFIILWIVLAVHINLKLTFNYWQPYVIPNETLKSMSDFIDSHSLIKFLANKLFWFVGTYFMILAGIQEWKFKNKYPIFILLGCGLLSLLSNYTSFNAIIDTILTIFTLIVLPLIINRKKWLFILITFALNFVFLYVSLWLEGFTTADNMFYIIRFLLNIDYYIMLILNYFVFNLIRKDDANGR